jgi:hypothetical protein
MNMPIRRSPSAGLNDPYLIAIGQILGNVEGRALVWACGLSSLVGAMLLVSLI